MSNDQASKLTPVESTTLKLLGIGVTIFLTTFAGSVFLLRFLWSAGIPGFLEFVVAGIFAIVVTMAFAFILENVQDGTIRMRE